MHVPLPTHIIYKITPHYLYPETDFHGSSVRIGPVYVKSLKVRHYHLILF